MAQEEGDSAAPMESERPARIDTVQRFKLGVFGNFNAGITYGSFGKLKNDLAATPVFDNTDFRIRGLGTNLGGQVNVLLFKRLLLGGGGTFFDYDASLSTRAVTLDSIGYQQNFDNYQRGEATVRANLFNGNIGFAVMNKKKLLLFPYVGYLTGTSTLTVKNYSADILNFGGIPIDRARTEEFTSKISMLEFGLGVRVFKAERGGLSVGADLGGYYNLGNTAWETSNGTALTGLTASGLAGGYFRITVGGGIFGTTQPAAPTRCQQRRAARQAEEGFGNANQPTETQPQNGNDAQQDDSEPDRPGRREGRRRRDVESN
jgi:hypothetical protein